MCRKQRKQDQSSLFEKTPTLVKMLSVRVGYWSSFKLLSSCTQPCLSHISIFLQTDLVWCKCLSHLHGETTMCCVYSHGSLCLHVWDSLQTQYIHDILSCIALTEHMCFFTSARAWRKKLIPAENPWFETLFRLWSNIHWSVSQSVRHVVVSIFPRCILFAAKMAFTIQINAQRPMLLLIFPPTSFKLPNANEIHIL